jgi:predicted thioesterase
LPRAPKARGLAAFEVREGDRTIGTGTHERRLIDTAAFGGAAS